MKKKWLLLTAVLGLTAALSSTVVAAETLSTPTPVEATCATFPLEGTENWAHDEDEDVDYRTDLPVAIDQGHVHDEVQIIRAVYSDEIFFKPSTEYHHLLAKQSIGLALSAFNLNDSRKKKDPTTLPDFDGTLIDYLMKTGFKDMRVDDYTRITSADTIASVVAHKNISYKGDDATLIVVAIRGGRYVNEWQSNLTVGGGVRHEGFDEAAQHVTDRVLSYLASHTFDHPLKLWITGFSRAGAVANLTAANLNDSTVLSPEQVYAYTFAAPRPVSYLLDDLYTKYQNIWNVMGASDFIPQFVPEEWGYGHYGHDLFLPGAEFDSGFHRKYKVIQDQFSAIGGTTYYTPGLYFRIRLLYGLLLEISKNEFVFTSLLQPLFLQILRDSSANSILDLMRSALINLSDPKLELSEKKEELLNYLLSLMQPILTGTGYMEGQVSSLYNRAMLIAHEHFPELYFSWLYNFTPNELYQTADAFDYVLLDQGHFYLLDQKNNETIFTYDDGKLEHTDYARAMDLEISSFPLDGKTMVMIPHDRPYSLRYDMLLGGSSDVLVIPYGRYFTSHLERFDMHLTGSGFVLEVDELGLARYADFSTNTTPSIIIHAVHIDKLGIPYRYYVLILGAIIALLLILLVWIIALIHRAVNKTKLAPMKLTLISLATLFAVEGEMAYWFSSDFVRYNVFFKTLAAFCILGLYLYDMNLRRFKKIDRTIFPFLIVALVGYVLISVSVVAGLALFLAGCLYLIVHNLRTQKLAPNGWIACIISAVLATALSAALVPPVSAEAILFLLLVPVALVMVFTGSVHEGPKKTGGFFFVCAMVLFALYEFSGGAVSIASMLYVILIVLSLIVFALGFDKKDSGMALEKDIPQEDASVAAAE